MGGACGTYGEGRGVHGVLVGKPEGKRPLGRPRRRWEDNIKMDFKVCHPRCVCNSLGGRRIVKTTQLIRKKVFILRWIFRKWEGVVRTGWSWLRIGTGGGHLEVR